jgi:hypothetical protein
VDASDEVDHWDQDDGEERADVEDFKLPGELVGEREQQQNGEEEEDVAARVPPSEDRGYGRRRSARVGV